MPGAGHLVHMPFHIYYRVGDYRAAIAANKAAVAIDEAYIAQAAARRHLSGGLLSAQRAFADGVGADGRRRQGGRRGGREARARGDTEAARAIPLVQPIRPRPTSPTRSSARPRTCWRSPIPATIPFVQAMWHYARGVAYAAQKNIAAAQAEADAIARLKGG